MSAKIQRYKPDAFVNLRTREEVEGYCVIDEDGEYVLYADHLAHVAALEEVLRELQSSFCVVHCNGASHMKLCRKAYELLRSK